MTAALDLTRRHFTRERGGITIIGTWISIEGRWRPCLALIRTGDEYSEHTVPCVVTVDKAWIWSEEIGDPREAAQTAFKFMEALRIDTNDKRNAIRLAMLIADHLGDLLHIPPFRPEPGAVVAEVTMTERETGRVREVELRDDV